MGQQESTVSGFSPFPISTKRDLYTNRDMMRTGRENKKKYITLLSLLTQQIET
jgi:hypothetical protein